MMRFAVVISILACHAAVKLDSSLAVTEMGSAQLLEMKNNLKHRLDMNQMADPAEKKVFLYFKQLLVNTSIPRLKFSATKDNVTILTEWQNLITCHDNLQASRNGVWTETRNEWIEKREEHDECRVNQTRPNTTCENCKTLMSNYGSYPTGQVDDATPVYHTTATVLALTQPSSVAYGDDRKYADLIQWFDDYSLWHCGTIPCQDTASTHATRLACAESCVPKCLDEMDQHSNLVTKCNLLQKEFEQLTCDWDDYQTTACDAFATCTEHHHNQYNTTIIISHGAHKRRDLEYQMMMTIVCFLDLLVLEDRVTNDMKVNCQAHYDADFLNLHYPHTVYQDSDLDSEVYVPSGTDCSCTDFPLMVDHCPANAVHASFYDDPVPCTGFVAEYYESQGWSNYVQPAACTPCTAE